MIDCHAHLSGQNLESLDDELERARLAGIVGIVNVCTSPDELKHSLELAKKVAMPKIYTAASTTPHDVHRQDPHFITQIEECASLLVAIGETGLDYFYEHSPRKEQQAAFRAYIELALRVNLPIVIHCRDAFVDLFAIFDEYKVLPHVMLHCFTGSVKEAQSAIERSFYISLSGIVTFAKSQALQEVVPYIPDELLLLETDAPYLAPRRHRGQKNEPSFIVETLEFVAGLKNVSSDVLMTQIAQNAKTLFKFV